MSTKTRFEKRPEVLRKWPISFSVNIECCNLWCGVKGFVYSDVVSFGVIVSFYFIVIIARGIPRVFATVTVNKLITICYSVCLKTIQFGPFLNSLLV